MRKRLKMKNNSFTVAEGCRMVTAVLALSAALSVIPKGILGEVLKYLLYALLIVFAGYGIKFSLIPIPKKKTAMGVGVMLLMSILISYIMPSKNVDFDAISVISIVFLAPIFEELFFRGAMITSAHPVVSCVVSSLVFGMFHGASFIQASLLGLILSYFYISSRNIAVPIICHFANNMVAVINTYCDLRIPIMIFSAVTILVIYLIGVKNEKKIL